MIPTVVNRSRLRDATCTDSPRKGKIFGYRQEMLTTGSVVPGVGGPVRTSKAGCTSTASEAGVNVEL